MMEQVKLAELKNKAAQHGLPVSGTKADIWKRLSDRFPDEMWVQEILSSRQAKPGEGRDEGQEVPLPTESSSDEEDLPAGGTKSKSNSRNTNDRRAILKLEIQLLEEKRRLVQMECDLERREMLLLRREHTSSLSRTTESRESNTVAANVKMVAELVGEFDGNAEKFTVWEKQLRLIQESHNLSDEATKIIIGTKLKGKAIEWFHSKAEHISMPLNNLLDELKRMFCPRHSRLTLKKKFEERKWKKTETFREYAHEKIILGNRVPVSEEDMLDYLIDGITDKMMLNQAKIQCFENKEQLINAFDKITFYETEVDKTDINRKNFVNKHETNTDKADDFKKNNKRNCFNCGKSGHISTNCMSKKLGPKCFKCGKHGHIATECKNLQEGAGKACSVATVASKKYTKIVKIGENDIEALIDTGSDLTLMREDLHVAIGSPKLTKTQVRFKGIDSSTLHSIGEFEAEMVVDGLIDKILIRVVSKKWCTQKFVIGTDFLAKTDFSTRKGKIYFEKNNRNYETLPDIFQIDVIEAEKKFDLNLQHINDKVIKDNIISLVNSYKPDRKTETTVTMNLVLKDDQPVYQRARRLSQHERKIVNDQLVVWTEKGVVRPSSSDYASPIVLVKKKNGDYRLCVDFRKLNQKIVRDRYPLPLIEDQLDQLQGASVFSTLDLRDGFFHIPMAEKSIKYTSFIVPDGQYEFLRVPFGLCNSPAVFQRYVHAIFREAMREGFVVIYMDDIMVISQNYEEGIERLKKILLIASNAGLDINWKKCCFLCKRVEFLGHIIENGTVRPSDRKTEAVVNFPKPTTIRQVQSFLGLSGYFRKFVEGYAVIARPLSNLLRSTVKFEFGENEEVAFNTLKSILSKQPILALYRVGAETELHTDASKHGYGAIIFQRNDEDGTLHPIYYASGKTTPAEENYHSYELEVLAIVKALRRFRVYLLGIKFKLVTDCKAFTMTLSKKDLCVRVARWALLLEEFDYVVEHRAGQNMRHVDALSRNPLPSSLVVSENDEGLLARIRKAQTEDDELKNKIEAAKDGKCHGFIMQRGVLFKEVGDELRIVIPKAMQFQIIRRIHENGHFGASKTETMVSNEYWMTDIRAKVERTVKNCLPCILAERQQGKQQGFLHPIEKGSVPLDTYHIDHLGPLASTKKSYAHILVVIDAFTKYVWLYATKSTTSVEVINHLKKQAVLFGNPRKIISDRGTAFTSAEFESYCKEEGIEHKLTTTGIPRGNGQVERVNRTLIPLLTKMASPNSSEWYKHLNDAQKFLNATVHKTTGVTPFRLMFGVEAKLKTNFKIGELLEDELTALFETERDEWRDYAKDSICKMQDQNKKQYNKRRKKPFSYRNGDIVAIRKTQVGPGSKFMNKYIGPYEVIKVLRSDRYVVRKIGDDVGPRQTASAADSMKLWINGDDDDEWSDDDVLERIDSRDDC